MGVGAAVGHGCGRGVADKAPAAAQFGGFSSKVRLYDSPSPVLIFIVNVRLRCSRYSCVFLHPGNFYLMACHFLHDEVHITLNGCSF